MLKLWQNKKRKNILNNKIEKEIKKEEKRKNKKKLIWNKMNDELKNFNKALGKFQNKKQSPNYLC